MEWTDQLLLIWVMGMSPSDISCINVGEKQKETIYTKKKSLDYFMPCLGFFSYVEIY